MLPRMHASLTGGVLSPLSSKALRVDDQMSVFFCYTSACLRSLLRVCCSVAVCLHVFCASLRSVSAFVLLCPCVCRSYYSCISLYLDVCFFVLHC